MLWSPACSIRRVCCSSGWLQGLGRASNSCTDEDAVAEVGCLCDNLDQRCRGEEARRTRGPRSSLVSWLGYPWLTKETGDANERKAQLLLPVRMLPILSHADIRIELTELSVCVLLLATVMDGSAWSCRKVAPSVGVMETPRWTRDTQEWWEGNKHCKKGMLLRDTERCSTVTETSCRGAAGCIYCAYESTSNYDSKVGLRNPSHVPPRNESRTVQVVSLLVALPQVTRTRAEVGNHRKDGRLGADRCSSRTNDKRVAFRAGRRLPQPWPKYWNEWSAFASSQLPREVQI